MSRARDVANLGSDTTNLEDISSAYNAGALSNRNLIINGAMQVAQRGNRSPSGFSGSFYAGPDRWLVNRSGSGTTGFGQISSTNYGSTKAAEATFLAAVDETFIVLQRIEATNIGHLAGQTVTLSFFASGSSNAGSATLNASLSYAGSTDNFGTETVISTEVVSYTSSAQKFTFTFTLPAEAANGVAVRLSGEKTVATGTFTLIFGGVQLEAGTVATPFEHRSFGQELALCQRYFQIGGAGSGFSIATTTLSVSIPFFAQMRASPSATLIDGSNTCLDPGVAQRNISSINSISTFGNATAGSKMDITTATTTNSKYHILHPGAFSFSAEL